MAPIQRSPGAWLEFLEPRLDAQARECVEYENYYDGIHRLSYATAKFKEAFSRFFPPIADNWMAMVVDSSAERLRIQGFRFGTAGTEEGPDKSADQLLVATSPPPGALNGLNQVHDAKAQKVWQQNKLDVVSRQIHTEAIKCGKAFILVDTTGDFPRVTGEHPQQVYVHNDVETGERVAAIKKWIGDDGFAYATIYLPDFVHKYRSQNKAVDAPRVNWQGREGGGRNPMSVVPMIPILNNPDMIAGGVSDLRSAIPIQDRINKLCLDLDVGSEFTAAPQRWVAGWDPPRDPATGQPLPQAQVAATISRMLAFPESDTKVGQLVAGDPQAWVTPIEMYVKHLGAITHTPPHYLLGQMANLSGDALKAAETGLVSKVKAKQDDFADPWEEAIGLAIDRDPVEGEVIWADPESRTFGQLVDGVVKLRDSLSLPLEIAWEMVGLTPAQIDRAKRLIGLPDREKPPPPVIQPGQQPPQDGSGAIPQPATGSNGSTRDAAPQTR